MITGNFMTVFNNGMKMKKLQDLSGKFGSRGVGSLRAMDPVVAAVLTAGKMPAHLEELQCVNDVIYIPSSVTYFSPSLRKFASGVLPNY